jgi:uncharacterized membrane protein
MQTSQTVPGTSVAKTGARIQSIDILRGAVMVLMAIDHVRCYSGQPAGGPTAGIFFTRWVTHFCAPAFVFFAGTSAFLYYNKIKNTGKLASFLLTRGLLLVAMELTIIKFFWEFNLNYSSFTLAGVIWMLGWCMVLLAAFVRLRPVTIAIIGLVIIAAQQVFHYVPLLLPQGWRQGFGYIWEFFYPSGLNSMPYFSVLFVLLPWLGVMMAGYGFGRLLLRDAATVKKICLWVGLSAIAVYLAAGVIVLLTAPAYQGKMPFMFRLLAQQKYPPSQLFLLMTLGPLIALVPFAQRAKGWAAQALKTIGRVPMFYYLLHILLIHVSALVTNFIISGNTHQEWYSTAPYTEIAEGQRWGLGVLYLVYAIDVVILYFACRQYAKYKLAHPEKKWLKYL